MILNGNNGLNQDTIRLEHERLRGGAFYNSSRLEHMQTLVNSRQPNKEAQIDRILRVDAEQFRPRDTSNLNVQNITRPPSGTSTAGIDYSRMENVPLNRVIANRNSEILQRQAADVR